MIVLTLNAGSSSLKAMVYELNEPGEDGAVPPLPAWSEEFDGGDSGLEAFEAVLRGGIPERSGRTLVIDRVSHRVVHGGTDLVKPTLLSDAAHESIARATKLAPLHNAPALAAIDLISRTLGKELPQVAVFDTAFHATLSPSAFTYAGPREWLAMGIRRYGFHGISHRYVAHRASAMLDRGDPAFRVVTCHLGGGSSLAAVKGGHSVDTTMGFTPLDGLPMATRSGSLDPGILLYLLGNATYTVESLEHTLNHHSGLTGLSGTSGDMRVVLAAIAEGNSSAGLAFDVYVHNIAKGIGAMAATMSGLDALVFTGGVGENADPVRRRVCAQLEFLGVDVKASGTGQSSGDRVISVPRADVATLVIHSEENWILAQDSLRV